MRASLKHLTKGVAIYGAGDAAVSLINFLLLPVYVKFDILTPVDYGVLATLGSVEAFAKVLNRWGLDGAFMRYYHERAEGPARRQMASTILWFLVAADGLLLAGSLTGSGWLAARLRLDAGHLLALRVMLVNMFLVAFTFLPFHVMRLSDASVSYSAFTLARSSGTLVLRIVLVIGLRLGITGIYLADLLLTLALLPLLWPWVRPLISATFSTAELRRMLRFGLPRLPHGLAQQSLDSSPKLLLGQHVDTAGLGVYQNGTTLSTGIRFFTSAFETAWAPFYYATARQPDAKQVFSKMTTYSVAVLVLLAAGTAAVAHDVILVMLRPDYLAALPVVPTIAVGIALQGVYLVTSIGLNLTSRTEFYPVSTLTAAGVGFAIGLWLIPRYGVSGAAATVLVSYFTQAAVAFGFSQALYRVHYEVGRLARLIAAGVLAALAALWLPAMPPLAGLFVRGVTAVGVYLGLLWLTGFFRPTERAFLREIATRLRARRFGDGA
ncbi:MAG TPA: lipopolysaccharide biosynthesis protein [Vicinamibacterales bacterium]|nr:lipopolysaccharide biosynthesis protein [Vicinamibacterales bacterium]